MALNLVIPCEASREGSADLDSPPQVCGGGCVGAWYHVTRYFVPFIIFCICLNCWHLILADVWYVTYGVQTLFKEQGEFLALDLGGSNFRVLLVKVMANGKQEVEMENQIYAIPEHLMRGSGSQVINNTQPTCTANCFMDCIVKINTFPKVMACHIAPLQINFYIMKKPRIICIMYSYK